MTEKSCMSTLRREQTDKSSVDVDHASKRITEEEKVPSTMSAAIRRFWFGRDRGPILALSVLLGMTAWRFSLTPFSAFDAVAFGAMVVLWWFQEYAMHVALLHSEFDWMGKAIHKEHHDRPYFHICIDPAGLMLAWLAVAHIAFRCVLPLPLALSATLGYVSAGIMYEWAHYIVHTRVKPPNRFWKRVRENHVKHHMVDNRYWLSFSIPAMDDWFGTNPSVAQVRTEQRKRGKEETGISKPVPCQ